MSDASETLVTDQKAPIVVSSDLLGKFGVDTSALSLLTQAPEEFIPVGRTQRYTVGAKTSFMGSINGIDQEAYATVLEHPRLTRLTLMRHQTKKAKPGDPTGYLITGMIKPIRIELGLVNKNQEIPFENLAYSYANAQAIADGEATEENPLPWDAFLEACSKMGMPLQPVPSLKDTGEMTLMWQHFTPKMETVEALFNMFLNNGGADVTGEIAPERLKRIERVVAHPEGFAINEFEIGRQDRSQSQYFGRDLVDSEGHKITCEGAGFQNLLDAWFSNFMRGFEARKVRSILKSHRAALLATGTANSEDIKGLDAQLTILNRLATSWMNSAGGAQRRITELGDHSLRYDDWYDAVQVPCGYFNLQVGNKVVEYDLWNQVNASSSDTSSVGSTVDTTAPLNAVAASTEDPSTEPY